MKAILCSFRPTDLDSQVIESDTEIIIIHGFGNENAKLYICRICGAASIYRSFPSKHRIVHKPEKSFVCKVCCQVFYRKFCLKRHLYMKHRCEYIAEFGQKLTIFKCITCGKEFWSQGELSRHVGIHGRRKNYQCTLCGKWYAHKTSLNQHRQRKHNADEAWARATT